MTAPNTFGVTADSVRSHFFPQANAFSTNSSPTLATVTARVGWAASDLDGALRMKGVDPVAIATATDAAYLWCAKTLSLMAARELLSVMTGQDPAWAKSIQADVKARLDALQTLGVDVLGSGAVAASGDDGVGPTTHIDENDLDTGDPTLISDVVPRLRRSDEL